MDEEESVVLITMMQAVIRTLMSRGFDPDEIQTHVDHAYSDIMPDDSPSFEFVRQPDVTDNEFDWLNSEEPDWLMENEPREPGKVIRFPGTETPDEGQ